MPKLINPILKTERQTLENFLSQVPDVSEDTRDTLNDLVHACTETGKTGEMTLKIKIKPIAGKAGQVEIDANVTAKMPQPTRGKTILFANEKNGLQRTDPRQQTIDGVRTVTEEADQQRKVRSATFAEEKGLRVVGSN